MGGVISFLLSLIRRQFACVESNGRKYHDQQAIDPEKVREDVLLDVELAPGTAHWKRSPNFCKAYVDNELGRGL
jgi:hypothetical protein